MSKDTETEDDPVMAEVREHRKLLDRLLRHAPVETDRPVPAHEAIPSQYSKDQMARQEAARLERVAAAEAKAKADAKAWETDRPRRERLAAERAKVDQAIAAKRDELAKLEAELGRIGRT